MELKTLDYYLRNALIYLKDSDIDTKGVVAAALVDGNNITYATSEQKENGTWLHAERNAVETHTAKYGLPTNNAAMVISLSPCIKETSRRSGDSCSQLLLGNDYCSNVQIKRIHVGAIDTFQADEKEYAAFGFNLSLSADSNSKVVCENLFNYFSPENYGVVSISNYLNKVLKDI